MKNLNFFGQFFDNFGYYNSVIFRVLVWQPFEGYSSHEEKQYCWNKSFFT